MLGSLTHQTGIIEVLETEASHLLGQGFGQQPVGVVQGRGCKMITGRVVVVLRVYNSSDVIILILNSGLCT